MRRRVTVVLALMLPLSLQSISMAAGPATKAGGTAASGSAGAAVSAGTAASSTASPPSAASSAAVADPYGGAPAASATPAATAAPPMTAPPSVVAPPAVSVDMTAKPPSDQTVTGGTYAVRLRDLEQRVDELKDQIRRSHTRLALLSDTILGGGSAGSRAEIEFENEMSSAFLLTRALFVVDGQIQYNREDDSGALAEQKEIPIYNGSVPPGDHTIQVALTFQGNGYGVFSYLRGYKFEVKSSHAFTALEGKALTVSATAYEKGGVTTPLEQRPTVDWRERIAPLGAAATPAASPAAPAATVSGSLSIGAGSGQK
jgi:hypothetical protein